MEYTITNRPRKLALGDTVIFTIHGVSLTYIVRSNFLSCINDDNGIVFQMLGISGEAFCRAAYGYNLYRSYPQTWWPECSNDDFEALTRAVNSLYRLIAKLKPKPVEEKPLEEEFTEEEWPRKKSVSRNELEDGDRVEFEIISADGSTTILPYMVRSINHGPIHLSTRDRPNDEIFNRLQLTSTEKYQWASRCYGYETHNGCWPTTRPYDYEALGRFVTDIKRVLKELKELRISLSSIPKSVILEKINKSHTQKSNSSINQVKQIENGKIIKTSRITPEIRRGEKIRGCRISGKAIRTSITVGYLSYATITV